MLATTLASDGAWVSGRKTTRYAASPNAAAVSSDSASAGQKPTSPSKWYRSASPGIGNGYAPRRRSA